MDDSRARRIGREYYETLTKEQKDLVMKVFLSTIDSCSDLMTETEGKPMPIFFYEDVAYRVMLYETLGHMINNELYNANAKGWQKADEFNPKY